MAHHFNFTEQGRRPTAQQIISRWKRAGFPHHFSVSYGETFAEFEFNFRGPGYCYGWNDSGNGCRGVDRNAVMKALKAQPAPANPADTPPALSEAKPEPKLHLFTPNVPGFPGLRAYMQLSDADIRKIGRGKPWDARVFDDASQRYWNVRGASCGLPNCFCAAEVIGEA